MKNVTLITDLQYGSTGKGLLAGYLALIKKPDVVITCNMPNAGHTFIDERGNTMIHKVLPNGVVSPKLETVMIGPGAVFDINRLHVEIDSCRAMGYLGPNVAIVIHPNAVILQEKHSAFERENLQAISSTMQGSAAAMISKIARQPREPATVRQLRDKHAWDSAIVIPDHHTWMYMLDTSREILAEGCQGFSLGINQQFYPFSTSRECTPHALMSGMGLPSMEAEVWGTLRTYPIRVGNTPDGYSGDFYPDQTETSWEAIGQPPELTTVTQRERRVFTFSCIQLREALWNCRPDHLFLNFANYMEPGDLARLVGRIDDIGYGFGTGVKLLGYGPTADDIKVYTK